MAQLRATGRARFSCTSSPSSQHQLASLIPSSHSVLRVVSRGSSFAYPVSLQMRVCFFHTFVDGVLRWTRVHTSLQGLVFISHDALAFCAFSRGLYHRDGIGYRRLFSVCVGFKSVFFVFFYSLYAGYCQPVRLLQVCFHGSRCYLFDAQCIGVLAPASLRATVRTFCALPVVLFTPRNTLYSPHKEQMRVRVWYCSI